MNRIPNIEIETASPEIASLYGAVKGKLGLVPNMVKALGNSPAALQGYLGLSGAVSGGKLEARTREKIALLVAEQNGCDYCLSAHTAIAGALKVPSDETVAARRGHSPDRKEQAILTLTEEILRTRGDVDDSVFDAAREAGVTTEEAAEVVAHVAVNVFTNYFNRLARTDIDFPLVTAEESAVAA